MSFVDKLNFWLTFGRWPTKSDEYTWTGRNTGTYDEPIGPGITTPMVGSSAEKVENGNSTEDYFSTDNSSPKDYGFLEYLEGLFASQGAELEANRKYNSAEAALNRQFQADEAQKQRDWYTDLSNSAYQRSMADMKAAGLNPILAYSQGGAASAATGVPAGSAASMSTGGGDTITSIVSAIAELVNSFRGSSGSDVSKLYSILKMVM